MSSHGSRSHDPSRPSPSRLPQQPHLSRAAPIASAMQDTCPRDPEEGGWMIHPIQHAWEGTLVIAVAIYALRRGWLSFRKQLSSTVASMVVPPSRWTGWHRAMDAFFLVSLAVSLALVAYHKYHGEKLWFLLQPCHMLHALLLAHFFFPRGSGGGAVVFSLYLHLIFAPLLGLVAADLGCYKQRFELFNWAFQHAMLLFVPGCWIATQRFPLYTGRSFFLVSFCSLLLYHFMVLLPASAWSTKNLNFMLCPPATVPPAVWLGRWYRVPVTLGCAFLSWILRYVVIEAFVRCVSCRSISPRVSHGSVSAAHSPCESLTGALSHTTYTEINLDDDVIVTNSSHQARVIQKANAGTLPVDVRHLHEARTITSLDRLPTLHQLLDQEDEEPQSEETKPPPRRRTSSRASSRTRASSSSRKRANSKRK